MTTKTRREDEIIWRFVSAYENGTWPIERLIFPDKVKAGGIDGLVTRDDGTTLAIEHTIIEPFVGDIADQTEMLPMFLVSFSLINWCQLWSVSIIFMVYFVSRTLVRECPKIAKFTD